MVQSVKQIRSLLWIDAETRFPIEGGGSLLLKRGSIRCRASYAKWEPPEAHYEDYDLVSARLEVSGNDGTSYALERLINANTLFELVRTAVDPPGPDGLDLLLGGLRCYVDHRGFVPTFGTADGQFTTLTYRAKHLQTMIDLLSYSHADFDDLVIRVNGVRGKTADGRDAPTLLVSTWWAARIIVWPSLLEGWSGYLAQEPSFVAQVQAPKNTEAAQALVVRAEF